MRLCYEKRERLITIYHKKKLHFAKNKYQVLSQLAVDHDIHISSCGAQKIVTKWQKTGLIIDLISDNKSQSLTKISEHELNQIERAIYKDRDLTAGKLKAKLGLISSERTIRRYVQRLGWRKVRQI